MLWSLGVHPGRRKLKRYKKMTLARSLKRRENRAAELTGSAAFLRAWGLYRCRHEFIPILRTLRDEGRIPGQFEMPPEGVETFEEMSETPEDPR